MNLADRVAQFDWYHTIELPGGVVTPGHFDTARECARLPLPDRLDGMRCLDVGTCDGFWAFELERRGAREVVGIDIDDLRRVDWPGNTPLPRILDVAADPGRRRAAFELARDALESRVERVSLSVYELDAEHIGIFDFVFMGSILAYLRDPVGALERIRRVLRGQLLSVDLISRSSPWPIRVSRSLACRRGGITCGGS